jgi:hypothetical protein
MKAVRVHRQCVADVLAILAARVFNVGLGVGGAAWAQINCRAEELGGGEELLTRARHDLHLLAVEDSKGHGSDLVGPRKLKGKC